MHGFDAAVSNQNIQNIHDVLETNIIRLPLSH